MALRKRRRLRSDPAYNQASYLKECHEPSIYFVRAVTGGPIKVGYTNNITMRLMNMQQGNPAKLTCLRLIAGDHSLEREIHARFDKHRLLGEWFAATPELEALATGGPNDRV